MPIPLIIWAAVAIVGGGTAAVVIDQTGDAVEQTGDAALKTATLVKWAAVAGGIYVSYAALKSTGVIK